jgi:cytochrome c-type biogenesis protein CcmH/NrfG
MKRPSCVSPTGSEYLGSARAGNGDRAKAAAYYQKLLALAKDADTARPELVSAKKLAQL